MKPRLKKITLIVLTLAALLFLANSSFAAVGPIGGPCEGTRALLPVLPGAPDPCSSPAAYVVYWFYLSLYLAGIAALLILVFAGFMRLSSGLVPNAVSSANKMVTNAALGFILLFSGWLLLNTLNPSLTKIGDSSFPPLGGCIATFTPREVVNGESSAFSWSIFFQNAVKAKLTCDPGRTPLISITKEDVALYDSKTYSNTEKFGLHVCTLSAVNKDNVGVGSCSDVLTVKSACALIALSSTPGPQPRQAKITWKVPSQVKESKLSCLDSYIQNCDPDSKDKECSYNSSGALSAIVQHTRLSFWNSDTCTVEILKPSNQTCSAKVTFP